MESHTTTLYFHQESFLHQSIDKKSPKKCQLSECELRLQLTSEEDRAATSFQVRNVYLDDTGLYCMQILTHVLIEKPLSAKFS